MSKSKRDYQDDSSSSNGDRKERRKLSSSRADEDGWSVYVLRNSKTGEIYTGCTNDLNARLSIHQTHPTRGARTTRRWVAKHGSDVVTIFAQVGPMTKSAAHSLEHKWKRTNGSGAAIEGRIKTFARLLKQAAERDGWVTDKCRFDFHMSFRVACTYPALLELASTKSNQVSSMSDLPGGDQVAWRPLPCIHNWTYGPSDLAKPWVPNGYLA